MKDPKEIKLVYVEPADYIPIETRRKFKIGEFAEDVDDASAEAEDSSAAATDPNT